MSTDPREARPTEQTEGYLVVLRPQAARDAYVAEMKRLSAGPADHREFVRYWRELLDALPGVTPDRYAGWDRDPVGRAFSDRELAEWPDQRAAAIADGADPDMVPLTLDGPYSQAERLMTERLGEDPTTYWSIPFVSESIIPDLGVAHEILAATDVPDDQEIIRVVRVVEDSHPDALAEAAESAVPETLGFDVGFWGGPFSIISDTMLYPRWHPAPDEDYRELREHGEALNEHMLCATVDAARSFRDWYRSKPWAEEEWDITPFTIARIDRI